VNLLKCISQIETNEVVEALVEGRDRQRSFVEVERRVVSIGEGERGPQRVSEGRVEKEFEA
jgi:hypothetical protein